MSLLDPAADGWVAVIVEAAVDAERAPDGNKEEEEEELTSKDPVLE